MPEGSKINQMFGKIVQKYDLVNHLSSGGIDYYWRHKVATLVVKLNPALVLDLATGTGDLGLELTSKKGFKGKIVGADFCFPMLKRAVEKKFTPVVQADAMGLPFRDGAFDASMIAFGVRNFENLECGLKELLRTLRPGGTLFILEFSQVTLWMRPFCYVYLKFVLPLLAGIVTGQKGAYQYLGGSILSFPNQENLSQKVRNAGFETCDYINLTGGVVAVHIAKKPA
ncbi:MAG: ubiquinone/menaquinone biosynthesis methyltransferase [Verrucomicrobiota bacterium]|nr:ubiquinone/menaquinone biosynthesis methyltransferase [Verrucomicrobiota bacterium]